MDMLPSRTSENLDAQKVKSELYRSLVAFAGLHARVVDESKAFTLAVETKTVLTIPVIELRTAYYAVNIA